MYESQAEREMKRLLGKQFARRKNSRLVQKGKLQSAIFLLYFLKKEEKKINIKKENPTYSNTSGGTLRERHG